MGRIVPTDSLDANFMTIEPTWGSEASAQFKSVLSNNKNYKKFFIVNKAGEFLCDENNKPIIIGDDYILVDEKFKPIKETEKDPWGLLGYYKRDVRLGNISRWNGELDYTRHWLVLAGDLLDAGFQGAFINALNRAVATIETSQAVGGFLRRRGNTVTSENFYEGLNEKQKKGLFGQTKE